MSNYDVWKLEKHHRETFHAQEEMRRHWLTISDRKKADARNEHLKRLHSYGTLTQVFSLLPD